MLKPKSNSLCLKQGFRLTGGIPRALRLGKPSEGPSLTHYMLIGVGEVGAGLATMRGRSFRRPAAGQVALLSTSRAWPLQTVLLQPQSHCPALRGTQPPAGIFPAQQHPARLDHHPGPGTVSTTGLGWSPEAARARRGCTSQPCGLCGLLLHSSTASLWALVPPPHPQT